jgi:transcriptional regulator with XRE-family HTH domain
MLTDFGKTVKKLMVDEGISQGQLAKELGISPAILSNYMTGKNIPEMKIIEKCIKRFNLEGGKAKEIFTLAFLSTAQANHSIHLDTRFFKRERLDLLAEAIIVIMLYPDIPSKKQEPFEHRLELLRSRISSCFKNLDIKTEYQPPAPVESGDVSNPQLTDKSYR